MDTPSNSVYCQLIALHKLMWSPHHWRQHLDMFCTMEKLGWCPNRSFMLTDYCYCTARHSAHQWEMNTTQLEKKIMPLNQQSLKQLAQGLQCLFCPLCLYYCYYFSDFYWISQCENECITDSWVFCWAIFFWIILSKSKETVFLLSLYVLFCYIYF